MNVHRVLRQAAAVLALGLAASTTVAGTLTFVVSGTLGNSFDFLHAGDAFTLTYTIDTSIPGTLIFQNGQTTFVSFDNVTSASVSIGGWTASSLGLTRAIDDPNLDDYEMFSAGAVAAPPVGGLSVFFFTLQLLDPTGALVTDAFTPVTNLSPFAADGGLAIVFANDQTALAVSGAISSIAVVPEPGTLLLLAAACAAHWACRTRRLTPRPRPVSLRADGPDGPRTDHNEEEA